MGMWLYGSRREEQYSRMRAIEFCNFPLANKMREYQLIHLMTQNVESIGLLQLQLQFSITFDGRLFILFTCPRLKLIGKPALDSSNQTNRHDNRAPFFLNEFDERHQKVHPTNSRTPFNHALCLSLSSRSPLKIIKITQTHKPFWMQFSAAFAVI